MVVAAAKKMFVSGAAVRFGVPEITIRRWLNRGLVPHAEKIAGVWVLGPDALDEVAELVKARELLYPARVCKRRGSAV